MSLRKSINRMCTECIYDASGRGSRAVQIALCTAKRCPLYDVRPITCTVIPRAVMDDMKLTDDMIDERVLNLVRDGHFEPLESPEGVLTTNGGV